MIRYIDGPEVRFTCRDAIFLDAEFFFGGETLRGLEPRRMFPMTGMEKYISLRDGEGEEVAMIRSLDTLDADSAAAVRGALEEYYRIPRIIRFIEMTEKFKIWMWTAETDKGIVKFEIRNHLASVKPLFDCRVLIKDANDNRYEIEDWRKLDAKSRKLLLPNI